MVKCCLLPHSLAGNLLEMCLLYGNRRVYYLDKFIFHPVVFSPSRTFDGVEERDGKTATPPPHYHGGIWF
jgi:hypothetical protein